MLLVLLVIFVLETQRANRFVQRDTIVMQLQLPHTVIQRNVQKEHLEQTLDLLNSLTASLAHQEDIALRKVCGSQKVFAILDFSAQEVLLLPFKESEETFSQPLVWQVVIVSKDLNTQPDVLQEHITPLPEPMM